MYIFNMESNDLARAEFILGSLTSRRKASVVKPAEKFAKN